MEDWEDAATKQKQFRAKKARTELRNCIISLLNSSIIDVDRLDYIIRDAATIGFKNVQIDYNRLLTGMRIVEYEGSFCIGYHKSALSVIESAVYAHDAEKKWVQSHPSILYEMEALKNAMSTLTAKFASDTDPNPIFCYEALTDAGKVLEIPVPLLTEEADALMAKNSFLTPEAQELHKANKLLRTDHMIGGTHLAYVRQYPLSLLADEDFLHLMKQFCKDDFGYEYFARNQRRHAVWKSEAEFRALFRDEMGSKATQVFENDFMNLVKS